MTNVGGEEGEGCLVPLSKFVEKINKLMEIGRKVERNKVAAYNICISMVIRLLFIYVLLNKLYRLNNIIKMRK